MNVVIVTKLPKVDLLTEQEIDRLRSKGLGTNLDQSKEYHDAARSVVNDLMSEFRFGFFTVFTDEVDVSAQMLEECDLCITVGGDGTVLAAQRHLSDQSAMITINSDPARSQGYLTEFCYSEDPCEFQYPLYKAIGMYNEYRFDMPDVYMKSVPRLVVTNEDGWRDWQIPVMNDILFTNSNPAEMSDYLINCAGRAIGERQKSSGVWISTAIGSTGAIHSAGTAPIPIDSPNFLFKVREPYHGKGRLYELENWIGEHHELRLTAATNGMTVYVDGSHRQQQLYVGQTILIRKHKPMTVLLPVED